MQHKIINLPHCRVTGVEVPEDAISFAQYGLTILYRHDFYKERLGLEAKIFLPPGSWSILGVWPDVSEEVAKMVVDKPLDGFYFDYGSYDYLGAVDSYVFLTAIESLRSLLISHGLPVDSKVVLLIEKM